MKKRKGFTLVELLVVIAIIALLMSILMPALAKVRSMAQRIMCGTNLSGIGKAMTLYAGDYNEEYPRAGGRSSSTWSTYGYIGNWAAPNPAISSPYAPRYDATITSHFYLLVKFSEVPTKQFVCKGDIGTRVFNLPDGRPELGALISTFRFEDAWDFGQQDGATPQPGKFCSYSYHMPNSFNKPGGGTASNPITATSNSACPVAADRNPYLDKNARAEVEGRALTTAQAGSLPIWSGSVDTGYINDPKGYLNSVTHQREGQNVLYNDIHVVFAKMPNVGIQNDNIWKCWETSPPVDGRARQFDIKEKPTYYNTLKMPGTGGPLDERDAYLVCESNGDIPLNP